MKRRIIVFVTIAITIPVFCGCSYSGVNYGDFFAVPKMPSEYNQLQQEIDKVLGIDGEFAAPVSGYRRQSIQLEDLDRDGSKEAVVFMRTSDEKPLRMCLFTLVDGRYQLKASVDGEGSSFDSVSYYDITGDGYSEIITGRSLGADIPKVLSVYSINDDGFYELMSNTYTGYTLFELDNDGINELLLVRHDPSGQSGVAEVFKYSEQDNAMKLADSVALSNGSEKVLRIKTGNLSGDKPAVFISSRCNKTDIVTDICAYRHGRFVNITMDAGTGASTEIVRQYTIFGSDLNGDKIFDLPEVEPVPSYEKQKSTETFYKITWRNYDLYGQVTKVMYTYHNSVDGWYFIIPEKWFDRLTIDRRDYVSGERSIVFSIIPDEESEPVDVLTIFTLTGDNKEDRSRLPGRFRIVTGQTQYFRRDTIFAALLADLPPHMQEYAITDEEVVRSFMLIQTEWLTGELST